MAEAKVWFYSVDGARTGPVSSTDLKTLAMQGKLGPDDYIWKEGMGDWVPAQKLKGLAFKTPDASPAAPPPLPVPRAAGAPPAPPAASPRETAAEMPSRRTVQELPAPAKAGSRPFGEKRAEGTTAPAPSGRSQTQFQDEEDEEPTRGPRTSRRRQPEDLIAPPALEELHEGEAYCDSCKAIVRLEDPQCHACGKKQQTSGIGKMVRGVTSSFQNKIARAQRTTQMELATQTGVSPALKIPAVAVAVLAGPLGLTGLGSMVLGRTKVGAAMLGIPLLLAMLTLGCFFAWFMSLLMSIFVIGIPFFLFFSTILVFLFYLTAATWLSFYIADITICIRAK